MLSLSAHALVIIEVLRDRARDHRGDRRRRKLIDQVEQAATEGDGIVALAGIEALALAADIHV